MATIAPTRDTAAPVAGDLGGALPKSRMYYVDNVRVFIIMATAAHHAANPYGGPDFWYFQSPDPPSPLVGIVLTWIPSFSMATLLLFSGYLVGPSFDRRGRVSYMTEKFVRLGIPLLIGFLIYIPLITYWYHITARGRADDSFWYYWRHVWFGSGPRPDDWIGPWPDRHLSHLWYIEHLFFYSVCYGIWRIATPYVLRAWDAVKQRLRPSAAPQAPREIPDRTVRVEREPPGWVAIGLFTLVLSAVTYVTRIWYPLTQVDTLLGFLQVEVAHYPHWLAFFFVGLAAYRYNWMQNFPTRRGMILLYIALALTALEIYVHFSPTYSPWFFSPAAYGGLTSESLVKTVWETCFCVSLTVGLVIVFRQRLNFQGRLARALSANAYAVHIFHQGVVVALQFLLAGLAIHVFGKFVIVMILGIILSNLLCHYVIRRLPFATRVL